MYFEIYQEKARGLLSSATSGQWRWRLKAQNHESITSGESYHNKQDCLHAIDLVKSTNKDTPVKET
jgi:uncharacterized protein YegP (UPF0339 family)